MLLFRLILLGGLTRLWFTVQNPFVCGALYAACVSAMVLLEALMQESGLSRLFWIAPLSFGASSLYFWLLGLIRDRFENDWTGWGLAAALGGAIAVFIG